MSTGYRALLAIHVRLWRHERLHSTKRGHLRDKTNIGTRWMAGPHTIASGRRDWHAIQRRSHVPAGRYWR